MKKTLLLISALVFATCAANAQEIKMLVGTYTEGTDAEGVYMYAFNQDTGESRFLSMAPSGNPSFVVATPDGKMAYSVNEFNDGRQGVSSYSIRGDFIRRLDNVIINKEEADGEDPCNILYTGDAIVTSNYTGGTVTAFFLNSAGRIKDLSQAISATKEHKLKGLKTGKEKAHMHCAVISPDGKYIFVTNLGNDCIHRFERGTDGWPLGDSEVIWKSTNITKQGPRHMVFSPDGRFAYVLCELSDQLLVFSYDDGKLKQLQSPMAYDGHGHGSADIHITPDGRFLYTSHRLADDGISIFSIDKETGMVKNTGYKRTGTHPRNFAITPNGRFLLCACRDDNRIEIYDINLATGALSLKGEPIQVGAPVCIQFIATN
ncbi:MAG: lactonase family protein [Bacteroidales bacterium]|nr:lactonase family protein [Bacteroidales bacterium]